MKKLDSIRDNFKNSQTRFSFYLTHFFFVNIIYFSIRKYDLWHFLSVPTMQPGFADLRAYTTQVTCSQQGINYLAENCDPYDRKIAFLQVWVPLFKLLNFNESKTPHIGNALQILLFLSIYSLAFMLKIQILTLRNLIPFTLILISPPMALLIERGQTEMFFFVSMTICVLLIRNGKNILAYTLLGLLSILKIYPLILIIILLLFRPIKKKNWDVIVGASFLVVGTIILFINRALVLEMTRASVSYGFDRTFGVTNIPYAIVEAINLSGITESEVYLERIHIQIIGLLFFCLSIIFLLISKKARRFKHASHISNDTNSLTVLIFMSMVFVSYFLISSYDYRMVYLIPVFLCYLKAAETNDFPEKRYLLALFVVLLMWVQYNGIASVLIQPFLLLFISSVTIKALIDLGSMYKSMRFFTGS